MYVADSMDDGSWPHVDGADVLLAVLTATALVVSVTELINDGGRARVLGH